MGVHVKKVHPEQFGAMVDGRKPFEWRKEDDCRYEVGDLLVLLEYQPAVIGQRPKFDRFGWRDMENMEDYVEVPAGYTGQVLKRCVTYVLRGAFGVPEGYVVMGLTTP